MEPLVITFNRHPRKIVDPANTPELIMQPADRSLMLKDWLIPELTLDFTPRLAAMTAAEWLREIHEEERVDILVLGYDNKFGSDGRRYTFEDYKKLGETIGVEIIEAPVEEGISSTAIRRLVKEGSMEEARRLLGHPFVLSGKVVGGKRQGRTLGFPTANIEVSEDALIPKSGVYVAEAALPDGRSFRSVVNIGYQPTMTENAPLRIEAHLIGYEGDLYGKNLRLEFLARLRDEKKFDSVEALRTQIDRDKKEAIAKL